jgi:hypothetical protein
MLYQLELHATNLCSLCIIWQNQVHGIPGAYPMGESWGPSEDELNAVATSKIIKRAEGSATVITSGNDDEDQSDLNQSVGSFDEEDEGDLIASVEAMALQDEYQASYIDEDDVE